MIQFEGQYMGMRRQSRVHYFTFFSLLFLALIWSSQALADQEERDQVKRNIEATVSVPIAGIKSSDDDDKATREKKKKDAHRRDRHHAEDQQSHREIESNEALSITGVGDVLPTASIASVRVVEGDTGFTNMVFTVILSSLADGYANVNYTTSDGTSRAATDYIAKSGILTISPGSTTATITVAIHADTVHELDETLLMTLSAPSANLLLGTVSATGTIINDDARLMNDTGVTTWSGLFSNSLTITQTTFPSQDADYGRDVNPLLNSNADGHAGFSFTKLDANGVPLVNQATVYGMTTWDCVQDNVTGLMWEVKTPAGAGGLRDASYEYSWYNSNAVENGGFAGVSNLGICVDSVNCDTEKYVAVMNAARLCGYADWRMPTKKELISIKDYGIPSSGLAIDAGYFPNTVLAWYWSATSAYRADLVWGVGFKYGDNTGLGIKNWMDHVRLVRGAR